MILPRGLFARCSRGAELPQLRIICRRSRRESLRFSRFRSLIVKMAPESRRRPARRLHCTELSRKLTSPVLLSFVGASNVEYGSG